MQIRCPKVKLNLTFTKAQEMTEQVTGGSAGYEQSFNRGKSKTPFG
jgi:hypothetical protein